MRVAVLGFIRAMPHPMSIAGSEETAPSVPRAIFTEMEAFFTEVGAIIMRLWGIMGNFPTTITRRLIPTLALPTSALHF